MLVSQQAKKFRIKNSLVWKPKAEQNTFSSCNRQENSCKSIFHSHPQFQFSPSVSFLSSHSSIFLPLQRKRKHPLPLMPKKGLKHGRAQVDAASTYGVLTICQAQHEALERETKMFDMSIHSYALQLSSLDPPTIVYEDIQEVNKFS